jgi:putative NADPH-quinone reductase
MMRALVLFAHPCDDSFSAALHARVVETLTGRGWQVDDCDLYAEGFQPVLTAAERRGYHDVATNTGPVAGYVDRLRAANALVMVFPVWNYGFPAILKGFIDRVYLPGVAFALRDGRVVPTLDNLRRIAAVTTYGGTWWRSTLAGDPPRKVMMRQMRALSRPDRLRYLALYDMNRATPAQRGQFLMRVGKAMEAF